MRLDINLLADAVNVVVSVIGIRLTPKLLFFADQMPLFYY